VLTSRDFVCFKVKTGRLLGQTEWQTALIEEMGSSYFMLHVSGTVRSSYDTKFHDVSMRTYLRFCFASPRLQERA
jgi:hypothetical protein